MRYWTSVAVLLGLAACQGRPPVELSRSLVASPELARRVPVDIAVLPVQDATPGRVVEAHLDQMRYDLASSLARQAYSPLSKVHVDAKVAPAAAARGSAVDAAFVKSISGGCDADAILGLRMTRWDESSLMENARVDFGAEVLMIGSDGAVLWSGRVDGSVKAGGDGPAPLSRPARARSAVEAFCRAVIGELPARRTRA